MAAMLPGSAQPAIGEHAAPAPDIPALVPHQVPVALLQSAPRPACGVPALVARRTGPGTVDAARGAAPHRDGSGTARCRGSARPLEVPDGHQRQVPAQDAAPG